MKIIWAKHAKERQKEWEKKMGITKEIVENVLKNPAQVVAGDMNTVIAQKKWTKGLLRVIFTSSGNEKKIITFYYTTKIKKYFKEE